MFFNAEVKNSHSNEMSSRLSTSSVDTEKFEAKELNDFIVPTDWSADLSVGPLGNLALSLTAWFLIGEKRSIF